jgi:hypothetical protein
VATIELKGPEALVLVDFLLRYRDQEELRIENHAEERILWDLCALLESQVPELLDPAYKAKLAAARELIAGDDCE